MLEYLSEEAKKGLLYIDILEASERKQFLAAVVSSATRTEGNFQFGEDSFRQLIFLSFSSW